MDDRETWSSRAVLALEKTLGRKVEIFLLGINDWNYAITQAHKQAGGAPVPKGLRGIVGKYLSVDGSILSKAMNLARLHVVWQLDRWGWPPPVEEGSAIEIKDKQRSLERTRKIDYQPSGVSADYAKWIGKIMDECRARKIECLFIDQPTAYQPDIEADCAGASG